MDRQGRVVVGVDGSEGSRAALVQAWRIAGRRGAELEVVGACAAAPYWQDLAVYDPSVTDTLMTRTEETVGGLVETVRDDPAVRAAGTVDVRTAVHAGPAAAVLLERSDGADVLVVGSRGRGGVRSALLGSVALHCVTHAACPVVVVHADVPEPDRPGRVVVGLDGSPRSRAALTAAVLEARDSGAEVEAVAAYQLPELRTDLSAAVRVALHDIADDIEQRSRVLAEEVRAAILRDQGRGMLPEVRVEVVEGPAREVLAERARGAELLVVGSTGRGALRGLLLGSVALHCAMHAPAPVMVVHPDDDRSTPRAGPRRAAAVV